MSPQCLVLSIVTCAVCFGAGGSALGDEPATHEPTTVALTMTRPAVAGKEEPLAENLLTLVELAVQADKSLAVVERRQIDLLIQELVLNESRPDDSKLQLGKLITADFLVMLEILPPDKDSQEPWGRLRLVDPKTGAIRGVTVAGVDEATLEETAEQFASYVSAVIRAPEKPTVTVAVAPFESKGRFARLRPLELGIRDLVTARLLRLSGAAPAEPAEGEDKPAAREPLRFQVVQRSNMEQLLRELDLIQSGLSDKNRLPDTLPARGAAFLVRGEIDEHQEGDKYTVIVRGEMVQAVTMRVVETFAFESLPLELEKQLVTQVDLLAERLSAVAELGPLAHVEGGFEVESIKQLTLTEMRRFRRADPRTGHEPVFHLPKQHPYWAPRGVEVRTLLGRHLLHKSVDRLESILFIHPDDAEAAFALGFCYSINEPDFYRPERADEMLRKVYALGRETRLGALALDYLSQIDFDDLSGKLIPGRAEEAIQRMWFAFANMPAEYSDRTWLFLRPLGKLHQHPEQNQGLAELVIKAAPFAERAPPDHRKALGSAIEELAMQLVRQAGDQPELYEKGIALLNRWAEGDDKELAFWGRKGLATLATDRQDFVAAAEAYEKSAALIVDLDLPDERDSRDAQLIEAAKSYRSGDDPARALKLLESFEVRFPRDQEADPSNDLVGLHEYEIGRCQAMLGHPDKALAAFLHATQINPTVVRCSDVIKQIEAVGGVPLDKDRDVDVKYCKYPRGGRRDDVFNTHLAADGRKIYVGDEHGVRAFDSVNESWEPTSFPSQGVTCLKSGEGQLFAGTQSDGLWQCDLSSGKWQRACPLDQLPDPHVESLALEGDGVYLGVGTKASGGLVRIDHDGNLHIFNEPGAPPTAPTHIVVAKHRVFTTTTEAIYEWSMIAEAWSQKDPGNRWRRRIPPQLFAGTTAIWLSGKGRELARWQATDEENVPLRAAWCIPANNTSYVVRNVQRGYTVHFVAQRGDDVWFGGEPYVPFVSSGLYRFNLKTGDFHKFSPADGFKPSHVHPVYDTINDGLWVGDRLWLATTEGLCAVTPLKSPSVAEDSPAVDEPRR